MTWNISNIWFDFQAKQAVNGGEQTSNDLPDQVGGRKKPSKGQKPPETRWFVVSSNVDLLHKVMALQSPWGNTFGIRSPYLLPCLLIYGRWPHPSTRQLRVWILHYRKLVVGISPKLTKICKNLQNCLHTCRIDLQNHSKWCSIVLIFQYIVLEDFSDLTLKFRKNPCMAKWCFEASKNTLFDEVFLSKMAVFLWR